MWVCPECGQSFVNLHQWHSCGNYTEAEFLKGASEHALKLYHDLIAAFRSFADFELHPVKTRVALHAYMRFAAINKLGKDYLDGHLILPKDYSSASCFRKVQQVTANNWVHQFRIFSIHDINGELKAYMDSAYKKAIEKYQ